MRTIRTVTSKIDAELKYLDKVKWPSGEQVHLNIGYFQSLPSDGIQEIKDDLPTLVEVEVRSASIVHYLRRTLEPKYVVGLCHVLFGTERDFTSDQLFRLLGTL